MIQVEYCNEISFHYPLGLPNLPRAPGANLGTRPALVFCDVFFTVTLEIKTSCKSSVIIK